MGDYDPTTHAQAAASFADTIKSLRVVLSHTNHQIHLINSDQNPAAIHMYGSLQNSAGILQRKIEIEELRATLFDSQYRNSELEKENAELTRRVSLREKMTEKAPGVNLEHVLENEELKGEVKRLEEKGRDEGSEVHVLASVLRRLDVIRSGVSGLRDSVLKSELTDTDVAASLGILEQELVDISAGINNHKSISISARLANTEAETQRTRDGQHGKQAHGEKRYVPVVLDEKKAVHQAVSALKPADQDTESNSPRPSPQKDTETITLLGKTYNCDPIIKEFADFSEQVVDHWLAFESEYMLNFTDPEWPNDHRICAYVTQKISEAEERLLSFQDSKMLDFNHLAWMNDPRVEVHVTRKLFEVTRQMMQSQAEHSLDSRNPNWMKDSRIVTLVTEKIALAKEEMTTHEALGLVNFKDNAWKEHPEVFAYVVEQIGDSEQQMNTYEALDLVDFNDSAWFQHPNVIAYVQKKVDRAKEHMASYQLLNMVDFLSLSWTSHPRVITHVKNQIRQAEVCMRIYQLLHSVDFKNPMWMKHPRVIAYVQEEIAKVREMQMNEKSPIEEDLNSSNEALPLALGMGELCCD